MNIEAISYLLRHCGCLKRGESVLVLHDGVNESLATEFQRCGTIVSDNATIAALDTAKVHGVEPPSAIANEMCRTDLIVCLTWHSMAHTQARLRSSRNGARFLSLPMFTEQLLDDPSIMVDYYQQAEITQRIAEILSRSSTLRVSTKNGTDIAFEISKRNANNCPGFVQHAGDLGSPPDIEVNIAPIEDRSNGHVVIDGSITTSEIGKLDCAVELAVSNGRVRKFDCPDREIVDVLDRLFEDPSSPRRIVAEVGIGLNPAAELTGSMLTDEGCFGCAHLGLGSNVTIGGKNAVSFHLDFVMRAATVATDLGVLMVDGKLVE